MLGLRQSDAVAVFDRLPVGVVLLDGDGRAIHISAAAERIASSGDGLQISVGKLVAENASEAERLRAMIAGTVPIGEGCGTDSTSAMRVSRPSMKSAYEIVIAPLDSVRNQPHLDLGRRRAAAVVFISDPEQGPQMPANVLSRLYGLTEAEARLATALATGDTLADFAARAKITANTVRWTLKQIFAKTDTKRQAELVRRLLIGPAAFDPGS